MHVYGELTGTLTPAATLTGTLSGSALVSGSLTVPQYVLPPAYSGPTEVTPSSEAQVLSTDTYYMTSNITINPIPSNYGLINWNGSIITVS